MAAPGAAADASTQPPLTKRAAAEAAFRHIKYSWGRVHAHPSLDDEQVNALMAHVAASNHMPAKDLFFMVCDIDGAILVVSPRLQSTKSEEQSSALALVCATTLRMSMASTSASSLLYSSIVLRHPQDKSWRRR